MVNQYLRGSVLVEQYVEQIDARKFTPIDDSDPAITS